MRLDRGRIWVKGRRLTTGKRTLENLTEGEGAEIRRLYVDERKTIDNVRSRMELPYKLVAAYLRGKSLTRTFAENSKLSPWNGINRASYAEARARRKDD